MERTLNGLFELDGVRGAMIIGAGGELLRHKVHSIYDENSLTEASRAIDKAIESLKVHHGEWEGLVIHFTDGKLMVRNLGEGAVLGVIADSTVNLAFANVAINVAYRKLKELAAKGALTSSTKDSQQVIVSSPGVISSSGYNEISIDPEVKKYLGVCRKALARSVGPMARVFVKEVVVSLAQNGQFNRSQIPQLIKKLEERLSSQDDLQEFRKLVGMQS